MQNLKELLDSLRTNISERLLNFAAEVIKLVVRLQRTVPGRLIGRQLANAATSSGANYEEACAGESRADFIHKLQVVLKELRESNFWLRLIQRSELIPRTDIALCALLGESKELMNIIGKSVVTAKKNN